MATIILKLPEFWETSVAAWFTPMEAQLVLHGISDATARFYHVVSPLGSSTAARAVSFITSTLARDKYAGLKAHLLKVFELSWPEQARRLLAIIGLGDSKPSEHTEMMLNLLGAEEPNFLFMELFLRHMPPHVQTAFANTSVTDPRALAEVLTPTRSYSPPGTGVPSTRGPIATDGHTGTGLCYFHARFGAKTKRCRAACNHDAAGKR
ncbi:uncharacterized protein LOC133496548 [Syngnathoides biaculeatus]|uniref:uncharacterized protein LOC133496548 n=1 Tax=Syngnathoides biaculeatus TaxID=300417 RepID=UPI002ADD532D|nr:uncharacterized protein LOC133496548 [Syngnathoides biaculeatus]